MCNEDYKIGYFIKAEVEDPEKFHKVKIDFLFFCDRMEIQKIEKLENFLMHIKNLRQALKHGLVLKNVHRFINFNKKSALKSYINMNAELKNVNIVF